MSKFDEVIYELVELFEKYDLYWIPHNNYSIDSPEDPYRLRNDPRFSRWWNNDNVDFALLTVIYNNKELFKQYKNPYTKLKSLLNNKKGLSDNALEELNKLTIKCRDIEHTRKLWIHNWLKKNCSSNFKKNVKNILIYRDNSDDKELRFGGDIEPMCEDLKNQYFKKFPFVEIPNMTKEMIEFASGTKEVIWRLERNWHNNGHQFFDVPDCYTSHNNFIFLMQSPENTNTHLEKKQKNKMKELKQQSNNIATKVGFFKKIASILN